MAWLRVDEGVRQLGQLAIDIDAVLGSELFGTGPPRPHLTVVRKVDRRLLDDLRLAARAVRIEWPVRHVVLYRSHTGPAGSRYEQLATFQLD